MAHNSIDNGAPLTAYEGLVKLNADGEKTLDVLISGVHCALCIQKIESTLKEQSHVTAARLNFSTGRLSMAWHGDIALANTFAQKVEQLGYGVMPYHSDDEKNSYEKESKFLLLCMGIAGFAMGNLMLLSVGLWATDSETMGFATRELMHWVSALIAIPTILFSGRPFFRSAWQALSIKQTNMDVPISLALILATGMSIFETLDHGEHVYFDSAVMLMFFLLVGRTLDLRARRNARSAATDLMQSLSGFANVVEGANIRRILIRDLKQGMDIRVAAGEKIPIDGVIKEGLSTIDTSLITGETLPRKTQQGAQVFAGTINQDAPLTISVSKAAENSLLADIVRLMEKAEQGQAQYVRLADKAAQFYTPAVHSLAALSFLLWFFVWGAPWQDALLVSVTVLIITCPCALGLAVPVVQVLATGQLMKRGILVKSGDALERLADINTVFFDKTGTLTRGKPQLIGTYEQSALQRGASLAAQSHHSFSQALRAAYQGDLLSVENIQEHAGKGMEGQYKDMSLRLGSRAWCGEQGQNSTPYKHANELWLNINDKPECCFYFSDQEKSDAKDTIAALTHDSLKVALLSGDLKDIVADTADSLGIEQHYGEQTPKDKHDILESYKQKGDRVLMVGDGLNDAPVLAAADISMAPGSAVDMAQNAADIVFMGELLSPVSDAYHTACKTQKLVKQNFALAIAYNCIAVPLAFAGLVTPMIAAIAMSGSSLLVIANSYRLKLRS
jgi:Cu2+-exporting ATPase